ncbi:MAG: hypothetical protein J5779_03395 [Clostridia bacterium]|nr:hypothetical protein [Clostridia bacterium]
MLFKLANLIMGGTAFLGSQNSGTSSTTTPDYASGAASVKTTVVTVTKSILIPVLGIVGMAGVIWAIVLGINFAKADSNEKREEAKKRLISLVVGIVVVIVLLFFFLFGFEELIKLFIPESSLK